MIYILIISIEEGDHVVLNGEEVATVYHTPGHR